MPFTVRFDISQKDFSQTQASLHAAAADDPKMFFSGICFQCHGIVGSSFVNCKTIMKTNEFWYKSLEFEVDYLSRFSDAYFIHRLHTYKQQLLIVLCHYFLISNTIQK